MIKGYPPGQDAIVAGKTAGNYTGMVEHRRRPGTRRVTIVTLVAGRQMLRRFAGNGGSVVTAVAGTVHFSMIHSYHRAPTVHTVASIAIVRTGDVGCRFTQHHMTVVTSYTGSDGEKMAEASNAESPGVVALVAIKCIVQMIRWFTWSEDAIVTDLAARRCTAINLIAVAVGAENLAVTTLQREAC